MTASGILDPVSLRIDGADWAFWKSVEITRQIDAVAGSFSLSLADRWAPGDEAAPLAAGQACEILIGADQVIRGHIDKATFALAATEHGVSVTGRDASADLVDCSAVHKPGQWRGLDALALARILAQPFGVPVIAEGDIGAPFADFKLEQGESAFEALGRALKQRELLAMPDGKGGIVLVKVGARTSQGRLVQGENVLRASVEYDMSGRYSEYIVQGQQPGNDKAWGLAASAVTAETRDAAVPRYRPKLLRAESKVDPAAARQRAAWENSVRAARSVTVRVTVQGFRQGQPGEADAPLWEANALTEVKLPALRLEQRLLIAKVSFRRDASGGSTTQLELRDPAAYQPEPKKAASGGKKAAKGGSPGANLTIAAEKDMMTRQAEEAQAAQRSVG